MDGDGAQRDVEEGPDEEETAHGQRTHVARDQAQLEPRAAEPDDRPGRGRGKLPGDVVGTRRTIQCTTRAAPIQPHVIQRAVLAV